MRGAEIEQQRDVLLLEVVQRVCQVPRRLLERQRCERLAGGRPGGRRRPLARAREHVGRRPPVVRELRRGRVGERLGDPPVRARTAGGAQRRGHGVAHERVREREAAGSPVHLRQQARGDRRLERVQGAVACDALDGHEVELGPRDGRGGQHGGGGVAESADPLGDELAHAGRDAVGLDPRPGELLDEQRVAAGARRDRRAVPAGAGGVRQQRGGLRREPVEAEIEDGGIAAQAREERRERRRRARLGRAQRRDDEQPGALG